MPRVLLIVNDIESGPRRLTQWLIDEHLDIDVRVGAAGTIPEPEALGDYDGLIMLGGGYMPDDTSGAPWLAREAELVSRALGTGMPQLGICLGGQLIAHVGGGAVEASSGAPEKGSTPITLTKAAAADPLFGGLRTETAFIESHVDRITRLPEDAVLLARSEACELQAFRLGEAAWGLQFHPEAGPENVRSWDAGELAALGFDKEELIVAAEAAQPSTEVDARAMIAGFATLLRHPETSIPEGS